MICEFGGAMICWWSYTTACGPAQIRPVVLTPLTGRETLYTGKGNRTGSPLYPPERPTTPAKANHSPRKPTTPTREANFQLGSHHIPHGSPHPLGSPHLLWDAHIHLKIPPYPPGKPTTPSRESHISQGSPPYPPRKPTISP